MRPAMPSFPADFLWGAATSAYQIEGATHEDGRGPSIWDTFSHLPGTTHRGETGDIAADHYHRMEEDVALMDELHLNAYRFSISWPRILPQGTGAVNARGLDFYDRLVDALLARGISPLATLYHWDLPQALQERGGWPNRETAYAFADYAGVVAKRLGDRVQWWVTQNEPWCSAYLGYGTGIHAPGIQDMQAAVDAGHHLLLSHGLALSRLRAHINPEAQLGIAINLTQVYAVDDRPETLDGVARTDIFNNRWFLDPLFRGEYPPTLFPDLKTAPPPIKEGDMAIITTPLDFLGVNYYSRSLIRARTRASAPSTHAYEQVVPVPGASYTEMAWEIYPDGLADMLARVNRDYAPRAILVTENGAAFVDQWYGNSNISDTRRVQYIQDHIKVLGQALRLEVPVRGYFVWSLMDNYEWTDGYGKRFGIVYIDFPTQRRIMKESGRWYAAFIASQQER